LVYTKNLATGQIELKPVIGISKKKANQFVEIILPSGKLEATLKHPFYVIGKGWIEAGKLSLDDKLLDKEGNKVKVLKIKRNVGEDFVYNIAIAENHNYFIEDILVHNDCLALLKDGSRKVVSLDEAHKLYKEGKLDQILDANVPNANNPDNPLNQAWSKTKSGEFVDIGNYTDDQMMEFLNSKDGYDFRQKYGEYAQDVNINVSISAAGEAIGIFFKVIGSRLSESLAKIVNFNKVIEGLPETVNSAKQGKHIPGTPTYRPGSSILEADAHSLMNGLKSGQYKVLRTYPNRIVVDFGKEIGTFYNNGKAIGKTQYGIVHYGQADTHIVPANPVQY
jgi:hypothetical protein